MMDSVPGPDAASDALPTLERATPVQAARYRNVLARLTTSYARTDAGQVVPVAHPSTTLGAAGGLISTALVMSIFLLPTLYAWMARPGDVLPTVDPEFSEAE